MLIHRALRASMLTLPGFLALMTMCVTTLSIVAAWILWPYEMVLISLFLLNLTNRGRIAMLEKSFNGLLDQLGACGEDQKVENSKAKATLAEAEVPTHRSRRSVRDHH